MDWRLVVMAGMALLIMFWFGTDGYLRIRAAVRERAWEGRGESSGSYARFVAACRIVVAVGVPAFVIAYAAGADIMWAVAGPPAVLLTVGLVEWIATRMVFSLPTAFDNFLAPPRPAAAPENPPRFRE